jgi:hypothetical protein
MAQLLQKAEQATVYVGRSQHTAAGLLRRAFRCQVRPSMQVPSFKRDTASRLPPSRPRRSNQKQSDSIQELVRVFMGGVGRAIEVYAMS